MIYEINWKNFQKFSIRISNILIQVRIPRNVSEKSFLATLCFCVAGNLPQIFMVTATIVLDTFNNSVTG